MSESGFPEAIKPGVEPKIHKLTDFTAEALGELVQYMNMNIQVPLQQILGFQQFAAKADFLATADNRTNTAYGDCTTVGTVGPKLTGLSDGLYLFLHGAQIVTSVLDQLAFQSIQVNSDAVVDADGAGTGTVSRVPGGIAVLKTLKGGGNNTVTCKYRSSGAATLTVANRWLVGLRYANA